VYGWWPAHRQMRLYQALMQMDLIVEPERHEAPSASAPWQADPPLATVGCGLWQG
jgi:hypothetical protein